MCKGLKDQEDLEHLWPVGQLASDETGSQRGEQGLNVQEPLGLH